MSEGRSQKSPKLHGELLRRIGALAAERDTRAFLVGGPVRDMLLGRAGPDLDIAVEWGCREIGGELARELGGRFVYHSRFLTGTVSRPQPSHPVPGTQSSCHIDIAQTRIETYSRPAVLPTVRPAGIEQDLSRRDFSINAIACEITPRAFGRIIDPRSGRSDIRSRVIRVLHDRSFVDDPTRAFRAVRFAVRLGFEIEPRTLELMRSSIHQGYPGLLTPERILYELKSVCQEPLFVQMFEAILKEGLLAACFPGSTFIIHRSAFIACLHRLSLTAAAPDLRYLLVLSRLPLTNRFQVTRLERDSIEALASFDRVRGRLVRARRPSTMYRLLRAVPAPALELLRRLETGSVADRIGRHLDDYSRVRPRLTGVDLRRLGLKPGPAYARVLEHVLTARVDGRVASAKDELALARRLVRELRGT